MTETDRILQAMTTMEEFTVADLVRACDASPSTVRTVLSRKKPLLEELGRDETCRPGGKWKRYRLRPDARSDLETASRSKNGYPAVPIDLIAVEEMLLSRDAIDAEPRMRESLLRRARRRQRHATEDPAIGGNTARAHQHAVQALITLVEGEGIEDPEALMQARVEAEEARRLLPSERELLSALDERIRRSSLRDLAPAPSRVPALTADIKESVLEGIVGVVEKILNPLYRPPVPAARYRVVPTGRSTGRIVAASRPTGKHIALQARKRKYDPEIASFYFEPVVVPRKQILGGPAPVARLGEPNQRVARRG
jgi:hypothetical protein